MISYLNLKQNASWSLSLLTISTLALAAGNKDRLQPNAPYYGYTTPPPYAAPNFAGPGQISLADAQNLPPPSYQQVTNSNRTAPSNQGQAATPNRPAPVNYEQALIEAQSAYGLELEPVWLLDTSESMLKPALETDHEWFQDLEARIKELEGKIRAKFPRRAEEVVAAEIEGLKQEISGLKLRQRERSRIKFVSDVFSRVIPSVQNLDAQNVSEEGAGGLATYTFAAKKPDPKEEKLAGGNVYKKDVKFTARGLGDLNSENMMEVLNAIEPGGNTYIMPAFELAQSAYAEEFDEHPINERPRMTMLVATDGALNKKDQETFVQIMKSRPEMMMLVGIFGYGTDNIEAVAGLKALEEALNRDGFKRIHVQAFTNVKDHQIIANWYLRKLKEVIDGLKN